MIVEQQKVSGNMVEKIVPTKDDNNESKMKKNIANVGDIKFIGNDQQNSKKNKKLEKIEEEKNMDLDNEIDEKKQKLINDNEAKSKLEDNIIKNLSLINKLKLVFLNKIFIFSCISKAIIFFIYEVVYIFFKIYAFEALHYDDEIKFFYYYSITTIVAPSLRGSSRRWYMQ